MQLVRHLVKIDRDIYSESAAEMIPLFGRSDSCEFETYQFTPPLAAYWVILRG